MGYLAGTHVGGGTGGESGFDINYGGARDLQLTAVVPLDYQHRQGIDIAPGDLELAAKFRFLHQRAGSAMPGRGVFSAGLRAHRAGAVRHRPRRRAAAIWAQKDIGKWSLFGGGAIPSTRAPGQRNYVLGGMGVLRAITQGCRWAAKSIINTRDTVDGRSYTAVSVGGLYRSIVIIHCSPPPVQAFNRRGKRAIPLLTWR